MVICGIKLTHDGSVALVEDGRLVFCVEMEKLDNNPRFTDIEDTVSISRILNDHGYDPAAVDHYAVDGWGGADQDALAIQPRLEIGPDHNILSVRDQHRSFKLDIAPYREKTLKHDVTREWRFQGLRIGGRSREYGSYLHAAGHIMGTYCTSPFARENEGSYILVWDGGMYPRLYFYGARERRVENLGPIFLLIGNIYTIFSQHFGPFKVDGNFAKDHLSVAGKVMAYIALGRVRRELFARFDEIYNRCYGAPMGFANVFANEFKNKIRGQAYSDEDILCTFHHYLEELLVEKLKKKIGRYRRETANLCLSGGCALNIKWNSAIRDSGLFARVYTPPFPNDSGSAVGAACCALFQKTRTVSLDWDVYSGPQVAANGVAPGWVSRPCSIAELARLLHRENQPVILLSGRSELGPRALGNRSIVAPAVSPKMKDILNRIKKRESYRPVSPICLEHKAPDIFDPGTRDPYMLFDHRVKGDWSERVPAIVHLDGTARLQTVSPGENRLVAELLQEYEKLSGIPLLCNTSANFKGCGFFPDVYSATRWNRVNYAWCNHILYEKENRVGFDG